MNTMAPHWPVFLGTHASTHALQHYVSYLRVSSACGLIYRCASLPVCASAKASSRTRPRGQHLMTAMHLVVEGRQAQHGLRCRVSNGGVCGGVSQRCGRVVRPIEWKRCHRSEYALKALTFWRVPQQRLGVVRIPSGLVYER